MPYRGPPQMCRERGWEALLALSRVQMCGPYRMAAGAIDELPALLCAHTRGLC